MFSEQYRVYVCGNDNTYVKNIIREITEKAELTFNIREPLKSHLRENEVPISIIDKLRKKAADNNFHIFQEGITMKITSFNPLIVTKDAENVIKMFEELGFKRHHTKDDIGKDSVTNVRMKSDEGFYVDVSQAEEEHVMIRMNVSDLNEATEFLKAHGFRMARHEAAKDTVDTGSSKFNIMVSPTGTIFSVSQHIKE